MVNLTTYTMTTTVTLDSSTAEQSILGYAVMKGYKPMVMDVVDEETIAVPNTQTALDFISESKQKEMVDDMLALSVQQIEATKKIEIEATRNALSQAVNVTIE